MNIRGIMGRHGKLGVFIAPLLIVLGYIGSDYYVEYQAAQPRIFNLVVDGHCDVLNHQCTLRSGELMIDLIDYEGITILNSTFALDSAVLLLVGVNQPIDMYPMVKADSGFEWNSRTPLRHLTKEVGSEYKLRLITTIKGGRYIGEFDTKTRSLKSLAR